MLNSFSQIFSFPTSPVIRKYQFQQKLCPKSNLVIKNKYKRSKRDFQIFQGILDFLALPIEHWALQYEKSLYSFALHQWVYDEIISFSSSLQEKISAANRSARKRQAGNMQNEVIKQLITQIRLEKQMAVPNFKKPKISLHNAFVLMTQYKVMEQIIHDLNTQQLEMMIDGLSFIYFHGVGKVQNVGEVLSQQQIISGVGGWGTVDQLTCCIHFITTHTKLYKSYPQKQKYSLMKQMQIIKMPNFISVYDSLQTNKMIDNIVNSIPMFMEFLQIFIKHRNNSIAGCQFVMNVKWLSGLGFRIMEIIQYNINKLLLINDQTNDELTAEELEIIGQLQNLNQQNEREQSQIVVKLTSKAMLIRQTEGSINPRILFSYAYHHLYTVNFMIKLTKKVVQLSKSHYTVYKETCQDVCRFLHKLFECVYKYEFNLPQNSITEICQIIKIVSHQGQYVFGNEEREVQGFDLLYSKEINSMQLKQFAKNLQRSERFGHYYNNKPKPKLSGEQEMMGEEIAQDFNVVLETNEESMFFYILSSIYDMKIDYLAIIYAVLKYADKRYLPMLQFYFLKNQLLHFLVQSEHQIQLKDKKNIKPLFNTLAYLIKGNMVSYAILNEIITFQTDHETKRNYFLEDSKKYFPELKQLLLTVLADSITYNMKNPQQYLFCPEILQKLLYPSKQQPLRDPNCQSKHEVWISYIANVILHELMTYKKKIEEIDKKRTKIQVPRYENLVQSLENIQEINTKHSYEQQIYDWITMILFLHIDYTQGKKLQHSEQILLAQFVMTYLTTILSEAIKWKYKNEGQKMIEFIKMFQDWENHYTNLILNQQNNKDLLSQEYGGAIRFLFLKRWNKKIVRAIKVYLESMEDYNRKNRQKRKSLEKVRSLKKIIH